eukprot:361747-Chlamydomonas_euryale.AAC.13
MSSTAWQLAWRPGRWQGDGDCSPGQPWQGRRAGASRSGPTSGQRSHTFVRSCPVSLRISAAENVSPRLALRKSWTSLRRLPIGAGLTGGSCAVVAVAAAALLPPPCTGTFGGVPEAAAVKLPGMPCSSTALSAEWSMYLRLGSTVKGLGFRLKPSFLTA